MKHKFAKSRIVGNFVDAKEQEKEQSLQTKSVVLADLV